MKSKEQILTHGLGDVIKYAQRALNEYLGAKQCDDDEMGFLAAFKNKVMIECERDDTGCKHVVYVIPQKLIFVDIPPRYKFTHAITHKEWFFNDMYTLVVIDAL